MNFIGQDLKKNGVNVETVTGSQTKATIAETNAINFAKNNGLGQALSNRLTTNSNNAITTGMYYASSADLNKPSGVTDGALFVMAYSSIWVNQLYLDWRTNKSYRRMCTNGTWNSWEEVSLVNQIPTKLSELTNDIGAGGGTVVTTSITAPTAPSSGDYWYKEV